MKYFIFLDNFKKKTFNLNLSEYPILNTSFYEWVRLTRCGKESNSLELILNLNDLINENLVDLILKSYFTEKLINDNLKENYNIFPILFLNKILYQNDSKKFFKGGLDSYEFESFPNIKLKLLNKKMWERRLEWGFLLDYCYLINSFFLEENLKIKKIEILHNFNEKLPDSGDFYLNIENVNKFKFNLEIKPTDLPFRNLEDYLLKIMYGGFLSIYDKNIDIVNNNLCRLKKLNEVNLFTQILKVKKDIKHNPTPKLIFKIIFDENSNFFSQKKNVSDLLTYLPIYLLNEDLFFNLTKNKLNTL